MDANFIAISLFFSIVGMGFFSYGKKNNIYFMLAGVSLLVYPYAVTTLTALILVGVILVALPFILTNFMPL